jgi:hypothetical protein
VKTKISGPIALSVFLSAAMIGGFYPTYANALDCSFFFATGPAVCGDSIVEGGSLFSGDVTASPNPISSERSDGPVAVGTVGSAPDGRSGAVAASGSFGEGHAAASANVVQSAPTGLNGDQTHVLAQGIIGFIDGFSISTALNVRITSTLDGIFTGQETAFGNTTPMPGTAGITFLLDHNNQHVLTDIGPTGVQDVLLEPGIYTFLWALSVQAEAVADNFAIIQSQTADASNTGRLFFDVLTPGGSLTFLSGHDYSSLAAGPSFETPLPAALPLFASGLGAFGLLSWRRKRKNAALAG